MSVNILGQNLTRLLDERSLTMTTLADMMGVAKSVVSAWITGKCKPRRYNVQRLCKALNVSHFDLFTPHNDTMQSQSHSGNTQISIPLDAIQNTDDIDAKTLRFILSHLAVFRKLAANNELYERFLRVWEAVNA